MPMRGKKMNLAWTSLTALSFMLTVPAWGTLLKQITGVLDFDGTVYTISPWSGVFMMLCLGFGLASIFGVMLGRGYSDKQWKLWHIIVLVAVFYAVGYLAKATVSHLILQAVQPEAAEALAADLKLVGIEDSGAGACSVRLAGYTTIGIAGGNIESSGTKAVCNHFCDNFQEIMKIIKG